MLRTAAIFPLLVILSSNLPAATTPALVPAKDNTLIQQSNPAGQLSNGKGDIFVGRTNQDGQGAATISIRRGLVEFDVAANVPAGATITGVMLAMRDVMGLNGDPSVELHRMFQDWGQGTSFQNGGMGAAATEGDATWLYRFYNATTPASSPAWHAPGGLAGDNPATDDFSSLVSAATVVSDDLGGGQSFAWTSVSNPQLIADVQLWLDHPELNFGWILLGDEAHGQTAKRFNSSESNTGVNVPPQLTITYTIPEPSGLLLASVAAFGAATVVRRTRRTARRR